MLRLLLLAVLLLACVRAEEEEANPGFFGQLWAEERFDKVKTTVETDLKHREVTDALEERVIKWTRELELIEGELNELTVREKALTRRGALNKAERAAVLANLKKRIAKAATYDAKAMELLSDYERAADKARSATEPKVMQVVTRLDKAVASFRQFVKDAVHCGALRARLPNYETDCYKFHRRTKADPAAPKPSRARELWATVRLDRNETSRGTLCLGHVCAPCLLGRTGVRKDKREGDGATPAGSWRILRVMHRADRLSVPNSTPLRPTDGWVDGPVIGARYNQQITLPTVGAETAEKLWRDDHQYDIIAVLDYNLSPVVMGRGSAIFFHVATPDMKSTDGCVAVDQSTLLQLLALPLTGLRIEEPKTL